MPVLIAVIGAVMTGLTYWIIYGNGLEHIDQALRDRRNTKLKLKSEAARRLAPVRSVKDPADAAGVLMELVARLRGVPTPEQAEVIEAQMRKILAPDDVPTRMIVIRHVASQAADPAVAVDELAPLLREKLTPSERDDLEGMLEAVAAVHQGPTEAQERLVARTVRALAAQV